MKFEANIEQFIQMRVEGKSFDCIAKELKTSKGTLIEWNKRFEVRDAIKAQQTLKLNTLVKAFEFDRTKRLETYLQLSQKINSELLTRDLTQIPAEKLLAMSISNDSRIMALIDKPVQLGKNAMFYNAGHDLDGFFYLSLDD